MQLQEEKVAITRDDLILIQLRDLKESLRDVKSEIKDIRSEIKDVRKELQETRQELNSRMNRLESKIESSSNHGQISNITTIGIALAVIYAVLK